MCVAMMDDIKNSFSEYYLARVGDQHGYTYSTETSYSYRALEENGYKKMLDVIWKLELDDILTLKRRHFLYEQMKYLIRSMLSPLQTRRLNCAQKKLFAQDDEMHERISKLPSN